MSETQPNISNLGKSMVFLLAAMNRENIAPLQNVSEGFVREALEEAESLLESSGEAERAELLKTIGDWIFKRDLTALDIHDSWFLDPLEKLPPSMITSMLSMYPPRLMRYIAGLVEERLGLSLGKITLNEISPPAAKRLVFSMLPPSEDPPDPSILPPELLANPLEVLSRKPFTVAAGFDDADLKETFEAACSAFQQQASEEKAPRLLPGICDSLVNLALALSFHPREAASIALRMPRCVGKRFLGLSKSLSLFIQIETAGIFFTAFLEYVKDMG